MGCDIHIKVERRVDGAWQDVPWKGVLPEDFDGRNYDLFGVLADVRNGTWGEEMPTIAQPRGWPKDSPTDGENDGDGWCGDHSFSWVTLAELQAYPWDTVVVVRGWVSNDTAAQFRKDGIPPESYSASGSHGEYIEWPSTVRQCVLGWPDEMLPALAAFGSPEDVRLCFGFDS